MINLNNMFIRIVNIWWIQKTLIYTFILLIIIFVIILYKYFFIPNVQYWINTKELTIYILYLIYIYFLFIIIYNILESFLFYK